jgi:hypothetical protein
VEVARKEMSKMTKATRVAMETERVTRTVEIQPPP